MSRVERKRRAASTNSVPTKHLAPLSSPHDDANPFSLFKFSLKSLSKLWTRLDISKLRKRHSYFVTPGGKRKFSSSKTTKFLCIILALFLYWRATRSGRRGHSGKTSGTGSLNSQLLNVHPENCQQLPNGGSIYVLWVFNTSPSPSSMKFTFDRLIEHEPNTKIYVLCGSALCVWRAKQFAHPCSFVGRLKVQDLLEGTPLMEWGIDHILAKILSVHYFEYDLQLAVQLATVWKTGGIALPPGVGPIGSLSSGQWVATSSEIYKNTNRSDKCLRDAKTTTAFSDVNNPSKHRGFFAVAGERRSPFLTSVLQQFIQRYRDPYSPRDWPVRNDPEYLISSSIQQQRCCVSRRKKKQCTLALELESVNLEVINEGSFEPHSGRHYGTLSFNSRKSFLRTRRVSDAMNIGDEIQGLAGIQFLPYIDSFVERDRLDVVRLTTMHDYSSSEHIPLFRGGNFETPESPTTLFLSGWFASTSWSWPPGPNVDPILTSMNFQQGNIREIAVSRERDYLLRKAPIGVSDLDTLSHMLEEGIPSFFSGCMTLALNPPFTRMDHERKEVLIVDVSLKILPAAIPDRILSKSVVVSHNILDESRSTDRVARYVDAFMTLKRYSKAKLVVTQDLSVALPCAALGTPVVLLRNEVLPDSGDQSTIDGVSGPSELVHSFGGWEFDNLRDSKIFDWDNPPQNPFEKKRRAIGNRIRVISYCNDKIRDSARKFDLIPDSWIDPWEKEVCSSAGGKRDPTEIFVATSLDMNFFAPFPTWLNALSKTNPNAKINVIVLGHKLTELAKCMISWLGARLLKHGEIFVISMDEKLDQTRYLPTTAHSTRISIATQARLFLSSLFPCVTRILWVDMDALVVDSLDSLWKLDITSECGIAARSSIQNSVVKNMLNTLGLEIIKSRKENFKGFNAGVMMIDLEKLRENRFEETIVGYFTGIYGANDQITYNMACNGTHMELEGRWNMYHSEEKDPVKNMETEGWGIVHFTGSDKPLFMDEETIRKRTDKEFRMWEMYALKWEDALGIE